jgi:hypothetical protein
MNRIMVFSIIGIIFFIYSLLCFKIRKVMCTINKQEFTVLDDRYFDLQLKVSIANSIVLVVGGATSQMFQLGEIKSSILFITVLVFSVINDVLKKIAVNKKYAQIVKNNN